MDIKVRNAAQARDLAFGHLQQLGLTNIPDAGSQWQERRLYAPGIEDYAVTSKLFTAGIWMVEVYQDVAPLSRTVYQLTAFNSELRWCWQGSIRADGALTTLSPLKQLSEIEARKIAAGISKKLEIPAPRPGGYGH